MNREYYLPLLEFGRGVDRIGAHVEDKYGLL
jgi:hypothetical protein